MYSRISGPEMAQILFPFTLKTPQIEFSEVIKPLILLELMQWWAQTDLNRRPSDYESPALTAELWAQHA